MSAADQLAAVIAAGAIGPSGLMGLQLALITRMEEVAAKHWGMDTRRGATKSPAVRNGWIPPKQNPAGYPTSEEEFPFITVTPVSGTDSPEGPDQNAAATFDFTLGAYSDDNDGWHQLLILIDSIRETLTAEPWLTGGFEHLGPLTWTFPDEQPRPQWLASVRTTFRIPRSERIAERNATEV